MPDEKLRKDFYDEANPEDKHRKSIRSTLVVESNPEKELRGFIQHGVDSLQDSPCGECTNNDKALDINAPSEPGVLLLRELSSIPAHVWHGFGRRPMGRREPAARALKLHLALQETSLSSQRIQDLRPESIGIAK